MFARGTCALTVLTLPRSPRSPTIPKTGNPATTPVPRTDSIPLATPGMYSFGTDPPLISDANSKSIESSSSLNFRLEYKLDSGILTRTSRLLLVRIVNLCGLSNGLTISYLRGTDIAFNAEFTFHTINNNFKMKFTRTFYNGL